MDRILVSVVRHTKTLPTLRHYSTPPKTLTLNKTTYALDSFSNTPPTILAKLPLQLHLQPSHPLSILRSSIESHFSSFNHFNALSPIVTVQSNFDDLGFPPDHPGRSKTDSYYINREWMLRTHTSAHEVEFFKKGEEKWLLSADVYRRDEIDSCHYPVFHQMEGAYIVGKEEGGIEKMERENEEMRAELRGRNLVIQDETEVDLFGSRTNPVQAEFHPERQAKVMVDSLKLHLNGLVWKLFGELRRTRAAAAAAASGGGKGTSTVAEVEEEPLQIRWIEATFPWTSPSYEVEVLFEGKWLEILGCGIVKQDTLNRSGSSLASSSSLFSTLIHALFFLSSRSPPKARLGLRTRP